MKKLFLLACCCATVLLLARVPAARAADAPAHALPITAAFEKVETDGGHGYILNLRNDSKDALKVKVTVFPSVVFHADTKARNIPEHSIAAGDTWKIGDLAAGDKVSVASDGYDKLDLVAP